MSFKSDIDVNLSAIESLGAMFNILLKQIDKQIKYKVTSDKTISQLSRTLFPYLS